MTPPVTAPYVIKRVALHQAVLDRANAPDRVAKNAEIREWFYRHRRARLAREQAAEDALAPAMAGPS